MGESVDLFFGASNFVGGSVAVFGELFEVLTLKRLGKFLGPVVLVNTNGYYERMVRFLQHSVQERFMSEFHLDMWSLIDEPEQVVEAMASATRWTEDHGKRAAVPAKEKNS